MSSIINFYKILPKKLQSKQKHDKNTNMSLPHRTLVCGSSGSGKTNVLLNLIKLQAAHFTKIVICTKNANEPLYNYLQMRIPDPNQLLIFEGIENIPTPEEFQDEGPMLIVFDDLVLENQTLQDEKKSPFFIRGRKIGDGISCVYLSQNFKKIPLNIRVNVANIIMK
jgi:septin family protein